jgi:hypothetical protein
MAFKRRREYDQVPVQRTSRPYSVDVGTDFMRSDFRVAIYKIKKVNRVSDSASAGMTQTYVAPQ